VVSDASCEMSPDGMTLTVRVASSRGALTTRIERLPDQPWTPTDVDRAVEMCRERLENAGAEPGQSSITRRLWLPGRRHLVVHLMSGPPTWWLPKASLKDHALMVGWLQRAVALWVRADQDAEG
jgi:hypothetical protein